MKTSQVGLVALLVSGVAPLALMGCDTDPTKGKEMAQAAEPVMPAPAATDPSSTRPGKTIVVTPANGTLGFVGAKVTDQHEGTFEKFSGKILLPEDALEKGKVEFEIELSSIAVEPAKLKKHLLSPDFFDVEKFPKATFTSVSLVPAGDGKYQVTGNLDLHGQKKSIAFPAKIQHADGKLSVDAEFGINRKDFGIVYPGMPDDLIKDEVLIKIALRPTL